MGTKIRLLVALVVIVGTAFWAFDSVRSRSYSGSNLSFEVGSGNVVVTNPGAEPIPVEMRAGARSTFRVESAELGLQESSKREGSGRDVARVVRFELPPGQAKIDVTRGSGVHFVSGSDQRIDAVVTPKDAGSDRNIVLFAGLIILGALYYISNLVEHRWIGMLRGKLMQRVQRPKAA